MRISNSFARGLHALTTRADSSPLKECGFGTLSSRRGKTNFCIAPLKRGQFQYRALCSQRHASSVSQLQRRLAVPQQPIILRHVALKRVHPLKEGISSLKRGYSPPGRRVCHLPGHRVCCSWQVPTVCIAVCCSVLQCVAVCCSVLQYVARVRGEWQVPTLASVGLEKD